MGPVKQKKTEVNEVGTGQIDGEKIENSGGRSEICDVQIKTGGTESHCTNFSVSICHASFSFSCIKKTTMVLNLLKHAHMFWQISVTRSYEIRKNTCLCLKHDCLGDHLGSRKAKKIACVTVISSKPVKSHRLSSS